MIYCKEVAQKICELIIEGNNLRQINKVSGLPSKATIMRWLNDRRKTEFQEQYRNAKWVQNMILGEYAMELCEKGYHYKSLGSLGARISKLVLKKHHTPRKVTIWDRIIEEQERRAKLASTEKPATTDQLQRHNI